MTTEQLQKIADLWNAGAAPNGIAGILGEPITTMDVVVELRKMDLERPTRPVPKES